MKRAVLIGLLGLLALAPTAGAGWHRTHFEAMPTQQRWESQWREPAPSLAAHVYVKGHRVSEYPVFGGGGFFVGHGVWVQLRSLGRPERGLPLRLRYIANEKPTHFTLVWRAAH